MLVLPLVVAGLAMALGFRKFAGSLLGLTALLAFMLPFAPALMSQLPPLVSTAILAIVVFAMFRGFMGLVIGRGATDYVVGRLVFGSARSALFVISWPFRFLLAALTGTARRHSEFDDEA